VFSAANEVTYTCPMPQDSVLVRNQEIVLNAEWNLVVHEKHQDDTYTCSMHPQIVWNEPGIAHLRNDFVQK
jgi:hypothetical protein